MQTLFFTIPNLAKVLSGQSLRRLLILLTTLWYFVLTRKFFKLIKPMRFDFVYNQKSIPMYLSTTIDIAALKEVFLLKEYVWPLTHEVATILDLGAHIGDTTLFYHALYPEAKIVAVEPSPTSFKMLQKNTEHIENITAVQAAAGPIDTEINLYISESSLGSSIKNRASTKATETVKQLSLASLLNLLGVQKADLIKFDIEGAEQNLFIDATNLSKAYIGEVHLDLMDSNLESFLKDFAGLKTDLHCISEGRRYIIKTS